MSTPVANRSQPARPGHVPLSLRVYGFLLLAYPREFRRRYGSQMVQIFCDCHRAEERLGRRLGHLSLCGRTLLDLLQTAPKEHWESLRKGNSVMKNLRRDAMALLGCFATIVVAFILLSYGRKHEVSSILMFGYALDAIVSMGIFGNVIVFLLAKTTKLNPLRTAFWIFLALHATAVALIVFISRTDPRFQPVATLIGYAVSFLFWFSLHWAWAKSGGQLAVSSEQ